MSVEIIIPDSGIKTVAALIAEAAAEQTRLALSELRLYQSTLGTPNELTTLAALDAEEADFQGYAAGGIEVTAFNDPYKDPAGEGVLLLGPLTQFNWAAGAGSASNTIGGAYLVTAGGVLAGIFPFENPVTVSGVSDSVPVVPGFRFKN